MITISHTPLDACTLLKNYHENSIEHKVLSMLSKSTSTYNYNSLDELSFEINMRNEIVESAKKLYQSKLAFEVFRKAKCNERFWKLTEDGGFLLRNDVKPSDAINDIFINSHLYATECATAMVIVYYKALLAAYGEPTFNRLFTKIQLMNWHYIDNRLKEIGYMQKTIDYFPGDRRYFKNPDVDPQAPECQGENVIDLSNDLYYGHGIGIYNGRYIINSLNGNRINGSTKSAYLMQTVGIPNFKSLFKLI